MKGLNPIETSVQNQSFAGAFSIGQSDRQNLNYTSDTPAPGSYDTNPQGKFNKVPGPKWSQKNKPDTLAEKKNSPSPASYNKQSEIGKGKLTISTSQFKDFRDNFRIGPLAYDNDTIKLKNKAPQYSLNSKQDNLDHKYTYMSTPGPQKYELKPMQLKKSHNKKQTGFGSGDRNSIYKNDFVKNPGPGSYDNHRQNIKSYNRIKFGKGKRLGIENQEQLKNPGAGSYDISIRDKKMNHSKSQTMTSESSLTNKLDITNPYKLLQKSFLPGPGQYDIKSDYKHSKQPSYKIGKSQRADLIKNNRVPGPGSYGQIFNKQSSHADLDYFQGFGSNPRQTSLLTGSDVPGPGNYNIEKYNSMSLENKGGVISHGKDSQKEPQELPGPGSYDIDKTKKRDKKGVAFGNSTIMNTTKEMDQTSITNLSYIQKNTVPGPGTYNLRERNIIPSHGYSFGTSRRMADQNEEQVFQTSPMSYNIKSNIGSIPEYLKQNKKSEF